MRFVVSFGCLLSIAGRAGDFTISTFSAGGTFNPSVGYGAVYPYQLAYPFTVPADANYAVDSALLALAAGIGTGRSITVSLAADFGGVPGAILDTVTLNGQLQQYPNDTVPISLIFTNHPLLRAGGVYWLIAYSPVSGNGFSWLTGNVLTTPDLQATRASPTSAWTASPLLYSYNNPGAFSVTGLSLKPHLHIPAFAATGISTNPTLIWSPSIGTSSYDVYLGTSPSPGFVGNTTGTSYTPPALLPNQTYYWKIVAEDLIGQDPSTVWSFTTTPTVSRVATAVLRDSFGGIRLSTYASSILSNAGGIFASDPSAAQDFSANTFIAARDTFNAVWASVYNAASQTWSGWQLGGGVIQGVPSLAVTANGTAWIASRDAYNSYWLLSFAQGTGFGTWVHLSGVFATDPAISACVDGSLYIVGKDNYNALWSGHYIPGNGFQGFQLGGGVVKGNPSVSCGSDNAAYIAARDNSNSGNNLLD